MMKFVFTSLVLIGALTSATVFAETQQECLKANAERADRDAYCFKQAQDAAIQETKERLDRDFKNGLKQNQTKGSSPQTNAPAPESTPAAEPEESTSSTPTTSTTPTTQTTTPPPTIRPRAAIPTSPQNAETTERNTTNQQQQTPPPPVLPKPRTHPPIQYY